MSSQPTKIRLKKGDTVIVRSGKYKGKTGKILAILPSQNKATVEGLAEVKRRQKPIAGRPRSTEIKYNRPFWVAQLGYYDQSAKKASRLSWKMTKSGDKTRVMTTSGKELK